MELVASSVPAAWPAPCMHTHVVCMLHACCTVLRSMLHGMLHRIVHACHMLAPRIVHVILMIYCFSGLRFFFCFQAYISFFSGLHVFFLSSGLLLDFRPAFFFQACAFQGCVCIVQSCIRPFSGVDCCFQASMTKNPMIVFKSNCSAGDEMTHNDFDGLLEEMGQHLDDGGLVW